jgi:hypothetical protein
MSRADDDDVEARAHALLSNAEAREDVREEIFGGSASGNFLERISSVLEIRKNKFLRQGATAIVHALTGARQRGVRLLDEDHMPEIRDCRLIARRPFHVERARQFVPQHLETLAGTR